MVDLQRHLAKKEDVLLAVSSGSSAAPVSHFFFISGQRSAEPLCSLLRLLVELPLTALCGNQSFVCVCVNVWRWCLTLSPPHSVTGLSSLAQVSDEATDEKTEQREIVEVLQENDWWGREVNYMVIYDSVIDDSFLLRQWFSDSLPPQLLKALEKHTITTSFHFLLFRIWF